MKSPGSQSSKASKGSSSLEQDFLQSSMTPEDLTNFITNNYANNNYYVPDLEESGCSADSLGLEEVDEIDTNNMEIYSGVPIKKGILTGAALKQEPVDDFVPIPQELPKVPQTAAGKSLLIPSKNVNSCTQDEVDLMLNVLDDHTAGTSGSIQSTLVDPVVGQNVGFDDTSQVSSIRRMRKLWKPKRLKSFQPPSELLSDDMFDFDNKTMDDMKNSSLKVTKYNPRHANDILRLNSATDYSSHLENVQNDLDSLKDLLRNDSYELNANQLMDVSMMTMV